MRRWSILCLGWVLSAAGAPAAAPPPTLADQAHAVLARHCGGCHGGGPGKAKGGLGYVLDRERLVGAGQIVPGRPDLSPLYQRVADGDMPPPSVRRPFPRADRDLLARWVAAGAPARGSPPARVPSAAELLAALRADLEALPPRQRPFQRYLTLPHLAPQRQEVRHALTKLVNSLSWHPRLSAPRPLVDGLAFRIDLRHYRWTARQWDRLAAVYPYRSETPSAAERELARLTGSERPVLRADWFVATAARPPHYHDLLGLPSTDRGLERLLQVDVAASVEEGTAARAGFNGSGVARHNRVIERHDGLHGAYWRSYDFSEGTGRQNLFEYPLGPAPGPLGFRHAGGEVIFHLPNGLQAYLLVDGDGRRVDKAPGDIVSDPRRPDKLVENGLSCFGCHAGGILPKDDQVSEHVRKNLRAFTAAQRDDVLALYVPARRFKALVREDNARYAQALARLGVPVSDPGPILAAVLRYEEVLDLKRAADELGVPSDRLAAVLKRSPALARTLGPLLGKGVGRQVFEEAYPRLAEALPPADVAPLVTAFAGPYRGHRADVRVLAWAPDGKSFASGDADGRVLVWDLATGKPREVGRHADEVAALAFSPDGRRLLSGGADRAVIVWDVAAGRRLHRLVGHTAGVRAVAVAPDGQTALSAGADRAVRVWNIDRGVETLTLAGHTGTVTSLAVSPDGRHFLSGGADRTARLWDLKRGTQTRQWQHAGEVHAVAFSDDGAAALVGDRAVTVRPLNGAGGVRSLADPERGVVVAIAARTADGDVVAVSGGQVRWFDRHGRAVAADTPARAAALTADGRALVAADKEIHLVPRPR